MPAGEGGAEPEAPAQRRKPPKIFYATRTHSQIAQAGAAQKGAPGALAVWGAQRTLLSAICMACQADDSRVSDPTCCLSPSPCRWSRS